MNDPHRRFGDAHQIVVGNDHRQLDDALALAVLLSAPDALRLVAVTTVSGDTRARAYGAGRLLAARAPQGLHA